MSQSTMFEYTPDTKADPERMEPAEKKPATAARGPMRILNLQAENVKRIVAVDITPSENTVVISGQNGAGKSSVLDCILWALNGAKHIQDKPIRDGQNKAFIKLDLGALTVERTFTDKGSYLSVKTEEGAKFGSAQEVLNNLLGAITFDPLEFARMKPDEQYETLKGLLNLDVDLDALAKNYKADFEERTAVNREVKQLEAQLAEIVLPQHIPTEPVDVTEQTQKLLIMRHKESEQERLSDKHRDLTLKVNDLMSEMQKLENKLNAAREELSLNDQELKKVSSECPDPKDIAATERAIETATEKNRDYELCQRHKERAEQLEKKAKEAERLSTALAGYIKDKEDAFARAKFPIEGLTVVDGSIHYNGIPFDQASSAEQLRVSAAIAISMQKDLRVMRIKDGSLLDDNGMKMLRAMADANDTQIWVERVGADPMSIIIEDGTVKT